MLMLADGYADQFPKLLERISESDSQTVLAEVYGKSLAEIEQDMNRYFRQSTIGGDSYKSVLQSGHIGAARAAPEVEIAVTLAKLLALGGHEAEAAKQLALLSARFQANWEIEEMLAYLSWRRGDNEAALRQFKLAFEHGAEGWKTYWDYARLLELTQGDRRLRLEAAQKALELKPDLDEARLMVGRDFYTMGQYAEATAELRQVKNVDPRLAARVFLMLGNAAVELQQDGDARQYAGKAKEVARTPDETAGVEALFSRLPGNREAPGVGTALPAAPVSPIDDDSQRPILRRHPPSSPSKKGR
jgi:tetratricopeptide (TPR) repeat protein